MNRTDHEKQAINYQINHKGVPIEVVMVPRGGVSDVKVCLIWLLYLQDILFKVAHLKFFELQVMTG